MKDKLFLHSSLEVRQSLIEGRGVFSSEDIRAGDKIEEAHIISLDKSKWEDCDLELSRYVLPWVELREDWQEFCDEHGGILPQHASRPLVVLGFGMIYNHSDDNNIDYYVDKHQFLCLYKANRDIPAGTELTITYGKDYFRNAKIQKK